MSDLYEIASQRDHDRACPGTRGSTPIWIDDDGLVGHQMRAFTTPALVCRIKTCTHPLYGPKPAFIRLRMVPTSWAEWDWLQPRELLF